MGTFAVYIPCARATTRSRRSCRSILRRMLTSSVRSDLLNPPPKVEHSGPTPRTTRSMSASRRAKPLAPLPKHAKRADGNTRRTQLSTRARHASRRTASAASLPARRANATICSCRRSVSSSSCPANRGAPEPLAEGASEPDNALSEDDGVGGGDASSSSSSSSPVRSTTPSGFSRFLFRFARSCSAESDPESLRGPAPAFRASRSSSSSSSPAPLARAAATGEKSAEAGSSAPSSSAASESKTAAGAGAGAGASGTREGDFPLLTEATRSSVGSVGSVGSS
mmetsp:Transcript_6466/g.26189  ORF Transcript_6466/g.26189 Transcript_6466/m.26189 type:complete len:282 (-) Transcript_6466:872-1717(-)